MSYEVQVLSTTYTAPSPRALQASTVADVNSVEDWRKSDAVVITDPNRDGKLVSGANYVSGRQAPDKNPYYILHYWDGMDFDVPKNYPLTFTWAADDDNRLSVRSEWDTVYRESRENYAVSRATKLSKAEPELLFRMGYVYRFSGRQELGVQYYLGGNPISHEQATAYINSYVAPRRYRVKVLNARDIPLNGEITLASVLGTFRPQWFDAFCALKRSVRSHYNELSTVEYAVIEDTVANVLYVYHDGKKSSEEELLNDMRQEQKRLQREQQYIVSPETSYLSFDVLQWRDTQNTDLSAVARRVDRLGDDLIALMGAMASGRNKEMQALTNATTKIREAVRLLGGHTDGDD